MQILQDRHVNEHGSQCSSDNHSHKDQRVEKQVLMIAMADLMGQYGYYSPPWKGVEQFLCEEDIAEPAHNPNDCSCHGIIDDSPDP